MGRNPSGSRSSDGVTDRTKGKWNKGGSGGVEQGTEHGEADRKQTHMEQDRRMMSLRQL